MAMKRSAEASMENNRQHKQSVLRFLLGGFAVILLFLVCLSGLILTGYGLLLILWPPFGPAIMGFGIALLASGIWLLRMLLRSL